MDTAFIFKAIQVAAIAGLFFLFVYTKMQKPSEMQKHASLFILSTIFMLFGYLIEMLAKTLEGSYLGTIISYFGSPFLMVSVFNLICTFYGIKLPKWSYIVMMSVALFITASVTTNNYHHLYYTSISYDETQTYSPLVLERGPLYFVNLASLVFYIIGSILVIFNGYTKSKSPLKRRLSVYSLLMVLSALLGFVLYFIDVADGYDTTMFGLAIGVVFLTILYFRCRVFDVVDMAKDCALDISEDGLLVVDDTGNLVYQNTVAKEVVGRAISKEYILTMMDGKNTYKSDDKVLSVQVKSLKHKNNYLGKSVEIHDITESYTHHEELEKAIRNTRSKLEEVQRTILGSFASLVEARSLETGDHIKRVSQYTENIARALKSQGMYTDILTENYINMMVYSAPLHDVGKISIPDHILLKPGKLTYEEFEEMKKHAPLGGQIIRTTMEGLESEEYVKLASDIATYHHERWDGNGYPSRLKGKEIPLCARIVALADCFDAMTSKRCYKEAFSEERAIAIIKEESGTHFDPDIVRVFLNSDYHIVK